MNQPRSMLLLSVLLSVLPSLSLAQEPCDVCSTPLERAAYDSLHIDKTTFSDEQFRRAFCDTKESIDSGAEKTDASLLSKAFFATLSNSKEQYHRLYAQYCENTSYSLTTYDRLVLLSTTVHDASLKAWSECIDKCMPGVGFVSATSDDEGARFVFKVKWIPRLGINAAKVTRFSVDGGSCSSTLKGKQVGAEWIPVTCRRNRNKEGAAGAVYITVFANESLGGFTKVVAAPPQRLAKRTREKPWTCTRDRGQLAPLDIVDGDRKQLGVFGCKAPGTVVRIDESHCVSGPCGYWWRMSSRDSIDKDVVTIGWKTNSSDPAQVNMTVTYAEEYEECVENCTYAGVVPKDVGRKREASKRKVTSSKKTS